MHDGGAGILGKTFIAECSLLFRCGVARAYQPDELRANLTETLARVQDLRAGRLGGAMVGEAIARAVGIRRAYCRFGRRAGFSRIRHASSDGKAKAGERGGGQHVAQKHLTHEHLVSFDRAVSIPAQ
jgi:hypothetical protein